VQKNGASGPPSSRLDDHPDNAYSGRTFASLPTVQADRLDCALDLMRRMPPQNIEENLAGLLDIVPDLTEDLLSAVDQPLKVQKCPQTGKDYLLCDYNRDGDSWRCVGIARA